MATGNTAVSIQNAKAGLHSKLLVLLWLSASAAMASEAALVGVSGNRALVSINGAPARGMSVGESVGDFKLLAIQNGQALVQINGQKRTLRAGEHVTPSAGAGIGTTLTLKADPRGHFFADTRINNIGLRMMVDTGATSIALGASDARRLGLSPGEGQAIQMQTANGIARGYRITLDKIQVGDITVNNVEAVITAADMPTALLGMSFLNRMEMQRSGDTMTLKKRY